MLRVDHLILTQGSFRLTADFEVPTGGRVSVIGPSGGGKSSLMAAIAGFHPVTSGEIRWNSDRVNGREPAGLPCSILFQDNNLFPHLTIAQNLGLALNPHLKLSSSDHELVTQALARVGLEGYDDRVPGQLSGGQQSRAALARTLVRDRPLMLLDEPFSALDPGLRKRMQALVSEIAEETGRTVLMVSHDVSEAIAFGEDGVIFVGSGRTQGPQPGERIMTSDAPDIRRYLGTE